MRARRLRMTLLAALLAGCDAEGAFGPHRGLEPTDLEARYTWVEEGWTGAQLTEPVGHPAVVLSWTLPDRWDGEPFRVYSRRSDRSGYLLAATVTSCAELSCRYTDLNVAPGEEYDFYVAAVDERSGREFVSRAVRSVRIPRAEQPATPDRPAARALDGAVYLRWPSTGAQLYRVFVLPAGEDVPFEIGATDGTSFLDTRARNGARYAYRVAAVDTLGHVGRQSEAAVATPRPDAHAQRLYPMGDSAAASGFRFPESAEAGAGVVPGDAAGAQWRLERAMGGLRIVPLGSTRVTAGIATTALTCGPQSDPDCAAVDAAPAPSAFGPAPVPVRAANSYVFRVLGTDGRVRYGKIRVQGESTDFRGLPVLIFDWAFQLVPDEPQLLLTTG